MHILVLDSLKSEAGQRWKEIKFETNVFFKVLRARDS